MSVLPHMQYIYYNNQDTVTPYIDSISSKLKTNSKTSTILIY